MVETSLRGGIFWSGSSMGNEGEVNLQADMFACGRAYTANQWLW